MKEMKAIFRNCLALGLLILVAVFISILTPAPETAAQGGGPQATPTGRQDSHAASPTPPMRLAELWLTWRSGSVCP